MVQYGPSVAFGIPGALMFIATLIFWIGRRRYVRVPPAPPNPHSFLRVCHTALTAARTGLVIAGIGVALALSSFALMPSFGFVVSFCVALVALLALGGAGVWLQLDRARATHPAEAVDGVRAVLRVLVLFFLVTPFWSLFDQKASTWVLQGEAMTKVVLFDRASLEAFLPFLGKVLGPFATLQSSQMQALNPFLVMLIIPFNNLVLYPALRRRDWEPTALRRMTIGLFFAAASWVVIGGLQVALDRGNAVTIVWQVLPYAILTLGEVLVSATGLEFAYSQAPAAMKGTIMSFWSLSVTIGNLWVLIVNAGVKNGGVVGAIKSAGFGVTATQMFFFAAFAFAAAAAFGWYARTYKLADHYRQA